MHYILDVDTGIDDALAILYAVAQQKPLAITTCFGNVEVEKATNNTLALLEMIRVGVPVFEGAAMSFTGKTIDKYAKSVHGDDGLANVALKAKLQKQTSNAVDYLLESAQRLKEQLVIIATGPLTNIALAIEKNKEAMASIQQLIIMGGAVNVAGNVSPYAEANILSDVEAADYVFASGLPITLVGLDVTMEAILKKQHMLHWKTASPHLTFCYEIVTFYMQAYENFYPGIQGCALHDPLAVAALFSPQFLTTEEFGIQVIQDGEQLGNTIRCDTRPSIRVCTGVDVEGFVNHFKQTIEQY